MRTVLSVVLLAWVLWVRDQDGARVVATYEKNPHHPHACYDDAYRLRQQMIAKLGYPPYPERLPMTGCWWIDPKETEARQSRP
jgi:hypothetical protein